MTVAQRQNEAHSIELLAAQRQFYNDAKWARRVRTAGTVGIALAAPIVVLFADAAGEWLGATAGAWIVLSRLVLRPAEQRRTALGAATQEEFDTYVLDLPWSDARGEHPPAQRVSNAARRHLRRKSSARRVPLKDWYADPQTAKPPYDTLLCQQANLGWSARLHGEWTNLTAVAVAVWFVVGVVVSQIESLSLVEYLAALLLPSLPAAVEVLDARELHRKHVSKRGAAESTARELWSNGIAGTRAATSEDCRLLQDAIWELREEPIFVPNWYYKLRRTGFETDMRATADRQLVEARRSGLA